MKIRRKTVGAIAAILLLACTISCLVALKSGQFAKWRSSKHLIEVNQSIRSGDIRKAQQLAVAALQLDPTNIDALRAVLLVGSSSSSKQILPVAAQLFHHPDATLDDRAWSLSIFLTLGDFRLFHRYFEILNSEEKVQPDFVYLKAGYFASQGDAANALKIGEQGPEYDERFQILRASLNAVSPVEPIRREAQLELARLSRSENLATSQHAYRKIGSIPNELINTDILLPAAEQWISQHTAENIPVSDELIFCTLRWLSFESEAQAEAYADKTINRLQDTDPKLISTWLLDLHQWDKAYDIATQVYSHAKASGDHETLFNLRIQALQGGRRWQDLSEILSNPPKGFPPLRLALLRAVTLKNLGR